VLVRKLDRSLESDRLCQRGLKYRVAAEKVISIFAGERKKALQIMTRHSFVLTQVGIAIFIIWAVAIGYVSVSARIQACPLLRNTRDTHVPPSGCARRLMAKLRLMEIPECPFANLPEAGGVRDSRGKR
jgi:hypothetical protein